MVRQLRSAHIVQRTIPLPEGREWLYELKFDWERNIPQLTMNTGERYQYFKVPRRLAIEFVRSLQHRPLLNGYRFERVRGRVPTIWDSTLGWNHIQQRAT